jgi:hypothetical protein
MTPEEIAAIAQRLSELDYTKRKDRERARGILAELRDMGDLPEELIGPVAQAQRQIDTRGGQTEPSPSSTTGQADAEQQRQQQEDAQAAQTDSIDVGTGAPLDFDPTEIARLLSGSGQSRFYGVPEMTGGDEPGSWVPFEAIVGDQTVAPRYPTGWSQQPERFGLTNEESIARAQILMEEAGLLEPGSFRPGVWDRRTSGINDERGWRGVLAFANATGLDWEDAFSRLYDAGTDASARGLQMDLERLSRTPYFEDPEKLRTRARSFLVSMGRRASEITDQELDGIVEMAATGAQQSQMAALTQRVERQGAMGLQGEQAVGALGGGGMPVAPLSEPQLDPIAHFDNALRQVMGREIESREAQEQARTEGGRIERSAGMIGSARG